jgi:PAS domain S-box-containing protein
VRTSKESWLRTVSQTVAWRYTIAFVAFLVSFFVRGLLNHWLLGISDRGLIIFLPATLLVTFFLGLGPAILTLLLSAVAAWYFFLPPYNSFVDRAIVLATFIVGSGVGVALVHWLRITITTADALQQTQAKYLRMLDGGFDAIILRDAQDRITAWNRGAESLYGWTRVEVLGRYIHSLFQTEFPKSLDEINADMRQNGRWEGELIHTRKDGARIVVFSRWTPEWDAKNGLVVSILQTNTDITERKRDEEHIATLAREAEHRTKNILATVQATVLLSQSETPDGLRRAIEGRIQALANVHALFVEARWKGAELSALARRELAPYLQVNDAHAHIDGPKLLLEPSTAQAIAMIIHELATNAAKYGALSVADGYVEVKWSVADDKLALTWTENGGPVVKKPTRQGFGTRMIERMTTDQHKGDFRLDWRVEGLACEIILPMRQERRDGKPAHA